jgi:hypothetical protein
LRKLSSNQLWVKKITIWKGNILRKIEFKSAMGKDRIFFFLEQFLRKFGHESMHSWLNESMNQWTAESISIEPMNQTKHWINESNDESINESRDQWVNEAATKQWTNESMNDEVVSRWTNESMRQRSTESMTQRIGEAINQWTS